MKILEIRNKKLIDLTNEWKQDFSPIIHQLTPVEAASMHVTVYITPDYKMVIGKEEYNFCLLDVNIHKVHGENDIPVNSIYTATLWAEDELIQVQLSQQEYQNEKWLKQLPIPSTLFIPRKHYQQLLKSIQPKKSAVFFFDTIGVHKLNGKYYYAASNYSITSDGINRNVRSIQDGFDLNLGIEDDKLRSVKTETLQTFLKYNQWDYEVFFPIHCIPILSILQHFLKKTGFVSGSILWIDGRAGSGKTQLAVTMGDFFNRGDSHSLLSHLNSPKAKYNDICAKLANYKNAVFILDDLKKEETSRNRDNSKNISDLVIRSIYMGKIDSAIDGNENVETAAIITGEFFKEQMSTISRILYLHIENFLNNEINSAHFKEIQQNCYYLARFMAFFLQWLLKKMEDEQEINELYFQFEALQQNKELTDYFSGKETGSRIIETIATFQLVSHVLDSFFKDCSLPGYDNSNFYTGSTKALLNLGYTTFLRFLNCRPLFTRSLKKILPSLRIKDCRYSSEYLELIEEFRNDFSNLNHMDYYDDQIKKISNHEFYNDEITNESGLRPCYASYLFGLQEEYDGILYKRTKQEVLLLKVNSVCQLIHDNILTLAEQYHIKLYESECTNSNILRALAEDHSIYSYNRKDGFGRSIQFPLFTIDGNIYNFSGYGEVEGIFKIIEDCLMIKINIQNIKCTFSPEYQLPFSRELEWLSRHSKKYGPRDYQIYTEKLHDAFNTIERFIDLQ